MKKDKPTMPDTPRLNNANLWDDPAFAGVNRGSPTMPDTPHVPEPSDICSVCGNGLVHIDPSRDLAHIDALTEIVKEPHHLGFPLSGKTGTYDGSVVMVKREWYERIISLIRDDA